MSESGVQASGHIHAIMEEQGAAWGMRREVALRAEHALVEIANSALMLNPALKNLELTLSFDELKLAAMIQFQGIPLQIAESAPSVQELVTDQGVAALPIFLICQYADRVKAKNRKGVCSVIIHLHY